MAEFLSPGVYVLEESSGVKPIAGVGTSTGAFVGIAERGPINEPVFIANFTQFVNTFGSFGTDGVLAFGVYQFFKEGGARCYVIRVTGPEGETPATASIPTSEAEEPITVTALHAGSWGNSYTVSIHLNSEDNTDTFDLKILRGTSEVESFSKLKVDDFESIINNGSNIINISSTGDTSLLPVLPEHITDEPLTFDLENGSSDAENITGAHFDTGMRFFDTVDDVNILAIPDAAVLSKRKLDKLIAGGADPESTTDEDVAAAKAILTETIANMAAYCQGRGDLFFVADTAAGLDALKAKNFKLNNGINSSYGALYYPWIYTSNPSTGKKTLLPPSGAMVGIIASTDISIGVHKAPAGLATGILKSAAGIERTLSRSEQDILNPIGLNVIRLFDNSGLTVWGARTTSTDAEWRYINVRRLFLMVEESLDEGSQWVVFEPNTAQLWGKIKASFTAFLNTIWRSGALFGATQEEAFYVKVDAENNPSSERDAGRLNIEVGIAPVKPAEFVIIRISQKVGGA